MVQKLWRRIRARPKRFVLLCLCSGFFCLNVSAYMQARAMTHFTIGSERTSAPEKLSVFEKAGILFTGISIPRPENQMTPDSIQLTYKTHMYRGADGNDLEAWHVPHHKPGGLVMMFHGYAASKDVMLAEAKCFHKHGYTVFMVDFHGSGGSSGSRTSLGYHDADDVLASIRYAKSIAGDMKIILYGQSMGSVAILRAMSTGSAMVDALVLENPYATLLGTVKNRCSAMGIPGFPIAELLVFWGSVQLDMPGFEHDPVDYARNVDVPTLLLHGEDDPRVTKEEMEGIHDALPSEKRLVFFSDTGHRGLYGAGAEMWESEVFDFLDVLREVR